MSRGSSLPEGLSLRGEIRGHGDLIVAGSVKGPISIDGHLSIEPSGAVEGEVKARSLVVRGVLIGSAIAEESIRVDAGARMVGDARAERVSVVQGALLRGRVTMTGPQASRRSSAGVVAAPFPPPAELESARATEREPQEPPTLPRAPRARSHGAPSRAQVPLVEERVRTQPRAADEPEPRRPAPPREERMANNDVLPRQERVASDALPLPLQERVASNAVPGEEREAPRRAPAPVIPGVGRQRARRKDGIGP
jgi:cytoskeletal protein CcmA (bactofilin family)